MSLHSSDALASRLLGSKKFRDAFVSARIAQMLALQIRVLRQNAGLSQAELANALGTSQNAVCRMENPRYGKHSVSTLKKIASFFDVGLIVRFAEYGEIFDWVMGLNENSVNVCQPRDDRRLITAAMGLAEPVRVVTDSPETGLFMDGGLQLRTAGDGAEELLLEETAA